MPTDYDTMAKPVDKVFFAGGWRVPGQLPGRRRPPAAALLPSAREHALCLA
jgi:hypothetical protein